MPLDANRQGNIAVKLRQLEKQPATWETNKFKAKLLRELSDMYGGRVDAFHSALLNVVGMDTKRAEAIMFVDGQEVYLRQKGVDVDKAVTVKAACL